MKKSRFLYIYRFLYFALLACENCKSYADFKKKNNHDLIERTILGMKGNTPDKMQLAKPVQFVDYLAVNY